MEQQVQENKKQRNRVFADKELTKGVDGKYTCKYNGKVFASAASLEEHLRFKFKMPLSHYLVDTGLALADDYIKCAECNMYVKSLKTHVGKHGMTSADYMLKYPGVKMISDDTLKGMSERVSGDKNPRHSSKVSEQELKEGSPQSIEFYRKRYPEKSHNQHLAMKKAHTAKMMNERIVPTQLEYYMKDGITTVEEARELQSKRQSTFSKKKCIDEHGLLEGMKRFKARQTKWQKTLAKNDNLKSGISMVSQKLFFELLDLTEIQNKQYIMFIGKTEKEFYINESNENNAVFYKYDYVDRNKMKIIEFNGDVFHGNPTKFKASDYPNPFIKDKTALQIWNYDREKTLAAERRGFEVLTIWEAENKKDHQAVINKCRKFLGI